MTTSINEFRSKQERIGELLAERGLDALLLRRVSSFAWATCGSASYVNTATSEGAATLLVTPAGRYLLADNIEAPRLAEEEGLVEQGWELRTWPWHEAQSVVDSLTRGLKLGADVPHPGATDLSADIARLRANLTPEEVERFGILAGLCAEAMDSAIQKVQPGQPEHELAGLLAHEAALRGAQPIVNLVATDSRVFRFRHPLPTEKKLERYAMLVLCGRRWGLVCSLTRLAYFGSLPDELRRKAEAVARVDAHFIAATRPGKTLGEVFALATQAYAEAGYPDEWRLHHQGGPAGYEPREHVATPGSTEPISAGQVYAWNPSITGTKSEDTILVGEEGNEVLTTIPGWPTLPIQVGGETVHRPAILEL